MYKNIKFSASIMCANWLQIGKELDELKKIGIDYIHYDVIDGNYASDFTMGSSIIDVIKNYTDLKSHYHLMVEEPMRIFDRFVLKKDDIFTIHQETSKNLHRDIIEIKKRLTGWQLESFEESYTYKIENGISLFKKNLKNE